MSPRIRYARFGHLVRSEMTVVQEEVTLLFVFLKVFLKTRQRDAHWRISDQRLVMSGLGGKILLLGFFLEGVIEKRRCTNLPILAIIVHHAR